MATKKWAEIRRKTKLSDEERAAVDRKAGRELLEMSLREVRELAGKNQVDVAEALEKAQSEISKIENREDWLLSTLRRYVEALGGELEVVAVLGDKRLRLRGV
jgi:hypothetical protein